jgi:methionyl-tRNA formyltransferase
MKIVFVGCVDFSASALRELIALKASVVGVCTTGRSDFNADYADLSVIAKDAGIPLYLTGDVNDPACIEWVRSLAPDVVFCFGWSRLLKRPFLSIARLGVVGYHPSKLPMNRGRHPIVWALALNLEETGSSFFFMDEGADTGDILSQKSVPIYRSDDASSLYRRITDQALSQIRELLPVLADGTYTRTAQPRGSGSYWRKRGAADGQIDWRMSADAIYDLVRALATPYVGAHFLVRGTAVKVWKTEVVPCRANNIEPGKVIAAEDGVFTVKAGVDAVKLCVIEPEIELEVGSYL